MTVCRQERNILKSRLSIKVQNRYQNRPPEVCTAPKNNYISANTASKAFRNNHINVRLHAAQQESHCIVRDWEKYTGYYPLRMAPSDSRKGNLAQVGALGDGIPQILLSFDHLSFEEQISSTSPMRSYFCVAVVHYCEPYFPTHRRN